MRLNLDAGEIFAVAIKIEDNGAKFYRIAADNMSSREAGWEFIQLSEQELEHKRTLEALLETYTKSGTGLTLETDEHTDLFLQSWADGHVFRVDVNPFDKLTGTESIADVIKIAIDAEKDSIVFYLGLKEALPSEDERKKIDRLIWEELGHYTALSKRLVELEGLVN